MSEGLGWVPDRLWGGMAAKVEAARALRGDYPPEWPGVAWLVKTLNEWRCERCGRPHDADPRTGNTLTVHHLDGVKWNLESWNLAALCQRCHLRVQSRVIFLQDWPFEHSPWMAVHVADYNEWARRQPCVAGCDRGVALAVRPVHDPACDGSCLYCPVAEQFEERCPSCGGTGHLPLLSLNGILERDYVSEWSE